MTGDLISSDADVNGDEAWIMGSHRDAAIRVRNLSNYLQRGGSVKDARLIEGEDGGWTVWVRLASRAGEFRLNIYKSDAPKVYRDVGLAIATCHDDFGYFGPITLSTDKQPDGPVGRAATAADTSGDAE
jgi:hypothetical protein